MENLLTFAAAFDKTFFEATRKRGNILEGSRAVETYFFNKEFWVIYKAVHLPSLSKKYVIEEVA